MKPTLNKKKFIIPMVMGGILATAPQFLLAQPLASAPSSCAISLSHDNPETDELNLDLDALIRKAGLSEAAIADAKPVSESTQAQPTKVEAPATEQAPAPRETFAQVFHADVALATKVKFSEAEVKRAEKIMGIDRSNEPEGLAGRMAEFVKSLVAMYETMDPAAFEAEKTKIQAELRKHNVTTNGKLLESIFFDGSLGEIDRAKQVHDIQTEYKKGLKEYMIEVTKASKKVDIRVGPLQKLQSKIPFIGGKTESELYDEAINNFFTEMVPIRTAIEGALDNVTDKETKANDMIVELKKLRIVLTQLKSEYETRITELILLQNAIVDYIENDPVLSQDPKNSLRRYLTVEVDLT